MSALLTQCPGDTVQTGTGKVDPARKFQFTTTARELLTSEQYLKNVEAQTLPIMKKQLTMGNLRSFEVQGRLLSRINQWD